jgi:hypothetical protein
MKTITFNKRQVLYGMLVLSLGFSKAWFQTADNAYAAAGSADLAQTAAPSRADAAAAAARARSAGPTGSAVPTIVHIGDQQPAPSVSTVASGTATVSAPASGGVSNGTITLNHLNGVNLHNNGQASTPPVPQPASAPKKPDPIKHTSVVTVDGKTERVDVVLTFETKKTETPSWDATTKSWVTNSEEVPSVKAVLTEAGNCAGCGTIDVAFNGKIDTAFLKDLDKKIGDRKTEIANAKKEEDEKKKREELAKKELASKKEKCLVDSEDKPYEADRKADKFACLAEKRMTNVSREESRSRFLTEVADDLVAQFHDADPKQRREIMALLKSDKFRDAFASHEHLSRDYRTLVEGLKDAERLIQLSEQKARNPNMGLVANAEMDLIAAKYRRIIDAPSVLSSRRGSSSSAFEDTRALYRLIGEGHESLLDGNVEIAQMGIKDPMKVVQEFDAEVYRILAAGQKNVAQTQPANGRTGSNFSGTLGADRSSRVGMNGSRIPQTSYEQNGRRMSNRDTRYADDRRSNLRDDRRSDYRDSRDSRYEDNRYDQRRGNYRDSQYDQRRGNSRDSQYDQRRGNYRDSQYDQRYDQRRDNSRAGRGSIPRRG